MPAIKFFVADMSVVITGGKHELRCEVITTVALKIIAVSDVTSRRVVKRNHLFGGTNLLILQNRIVS
jgi:hypothetical protein